MEDCRTVREQMKADLNEIHQLDQALDSISAKIYKTLGSEQEKKDYLAAYLYARSEVDIQKNLLGNRDLQFNLSMSVGRLAFSEMKTEEREYLLSSIFVALSGSSNGASNASSKSGTVVAKKEPSSGSAQIAKERMEGVLAADREAIAASQSGKPPVLPLPQNPGTVTRNALSDAEFAQAKDIVNFKGGLFEGAPKSNFPGIDGWLNGTPVQLKAVEGKSIFSVQRNILDGAKDMQKQGYVGDLYIDASKTGVGINKMTDFFKTGSPVSKMLNEGTVNNVYIKTQDGWLNMTQTTLKKTIPK